MEAENIDIEHLEGIGNDKFKVVVEDDLNFMKNNVTVYLLESDDYEEILLVIFHVSETEGKLNIFHEILVQLWRRI